MPKREDRLETAIQGVLNSMAAYGPDSPEYPILVEQLEKLTAMRAKRKWRVDPNTALLVVGNLLGILIIVAVEQNHVWRSKASDFIMKAK